MGIRVIKTAIAVVVSMYLAQWLHLLNPLSAGLLAILGIEVTRKKGIRSALQRIGASVVGLLAASLLFYALGFRIWVVGLFVLAVFPILNKANLREGATTGSVVMFHLYAQHSISPAMLLNELWLLLVGLGSATVINVLYMPKADPHLLACQTKLEQLFSDIFRHFADQLRDASTVWDGAELLAAGDTMNEGRALADKLQQNALFWNGGYWPIYFYMRGEQLDSIFRMAQLVAQVYENIPQGDMVARVFDELSRDVKAEYYTGRSEALLRELEETFRRMPLPATRGEFELRSALLQLMLELNGYLTIAKKAKKRLPAKAVDKAAD
ncbi:membrane protein [Gordoniibacillus kamchatkensis]|uniref:Membrane protein n=1 Tax=Gordoniibacillus kamchatkensis TaxID=1590651 RepID=A0ABR5AFN0_9BACL|nr:aromatic acid exporter family protein [Paenibacillus sp. VKM B-2647]KIL39498.1 membrane protein [Paenibacillus sp. VKM B-2647]